jgi:SAM-dependent methyltransferase
MIRPSGRVIVAGVAMIAGVMALARRSRRVATGRTVPGGVVMGDPWGYDVVSRLLLGPFFRGVAADVAAATSSGATVLEIGCGPGLLSIRLARTHRIAVTGLDLDPAMIDRARANLDRGTNRAAPRPTFVVGDVAALPFADRSFDLVVSTFSMHHWTDRSAGLAEIARVLRPGGRVLVWDVLPGTTPFHPTVHDHAGEDHVSPLGRAVIRPWRWPGPLAIAQRIEFDPGPVGPTAAEPGH